MKQQLVILLGIVAWALGTLPARAEVPSTRDLRRDAEVAASINGALLVVFVGEHCVYCERVLNEFLIPMSGNGNYRDRVVMRRVVVSRDEELIDFEGKRVRAGQFASRYGHRMVPTVMLLDNRGRVLSKPLVGLTTVDFYGLYLDEAIDSAVAKLRKAIAPTQLEAPR
jgi:thioredoxin-related protein